jgi:hypothetical protein
VLANGADHPELLDNVGNIALLQRAEAVGLLPAGVGTWRRDAYRELRRAQHKARLDEQSTLIGAAIVLGLIIKLALEQPLGPVLRDTPGFDFPVAPFAHLTGTVAGALAWRLTMHRSERT